MFVPQVVNIQGELDFFSRMEKTKICYMILKKTFKLGCLSKLSYNLLTLGNDYEKYGVAPKDNTYHFVNVIDSWHFHSFLTDIYPVRNYFGNNTAFQIFLVVSIIEYLALASILFLLIFLIEQFNESSLIITRNFNSAIFVFGFSIFETYWS